MTRRGWLLFATMSLVWGVPYLLIKVAVEELSPPELVLLRCALAAALLLPLAAAQRRLRVPRPLWPALALFTVLEMTGPWLLISYAEQTLSSGLAGLLVATVPIVSVVAGRVLGEADRLDGVRVAGLAVGMAGVGALLGLDVGGGELLAVGAMALVVLGYGTAPLVITRRLGGVPGVAVSAWALALTAVVYLPFGLPSLLAGPVPSGRVVGSVVALAVLCTAAALVLFFALIREVGPNRALVITFLNPAVAVALGIVVLGEALTAGTLVGFPLVLLGCVLATRRSRERAAEPQLVPASAGS
ncbi:MAG TPA: DMT family transporter [Mycobacteriales bacterium]|nr:DMT family transporter [Mycobacteriales bacterium]